MSDIPQFMGTILYSGWLSLLEYLSAHVLLCLLPAFLIAGYMSAMIPKETITRYLGPRAQKYISYPAAAIGGFVLAVCSCTILPLFAGIWKRGAGLGPAVTFLFVGPAVNILAITYTGVAIGMDVAVARIVLSIAFGIAIGLIMAWIFRAEEGERARGLADDGLFHESASVKPAVWIMFSLLIGVLIVGTLQVDILSDVLFEFSLPLELTAGMRSLLSSANLSLQGAVLIASLIAIAPVAYLGLEHVLTRLTAWTYASLLMVGLTLLLASPQVAEGSLRIGLTGRFFGELSLLAASAGVARRGLQREEIAAWLWETWKFVKQIFPLLLVGVIAAGMVKAVLPPEWVRSLAGRNTIWANAIGVLFGVFMYFPTLVEVPIARMFLDLGMHRGPLLAYLLADPELSLQSILVTGRILGGRKTGAYIVLVSVFSTLAGYLFGLAITLI